MEDYGGNLWSGLALHVAILAASWLQLVTYWYLGAYADLAPTLSAGDTTPPPEEASEPLAVGDAGAATHPDDGAPPNGFDKFTAATGKLLSALAREGTILATYIVVASVALAATPNLMSALYVPARGRACPAPHRRCTDVAARGCACTDSYLCILFVCLTLHQLRLHTWVAYVWPSFVIVSLACLGACYIYQFEDVQAWMQDYTSPAILQDIGLAVNPPPQLFAYLLQVCVRPRAFARPRARHN